MKQVTRSKCQRPGCNRTPEVFGSMWCSQCYYPGIHFDYQRYRDLREEGYSDYQARVMAGFADPDEAKE